MLPTKRINGQTWLPDFFNDFFEGNALTRFSGSTPAINVIEDEQAYNLEIAAPGMCKQDFDVHISKEGNLVIAMEKKCEDKECCKKERKYLRKEFSYTKFHQTLVLPENAERDNIDATVKDGVLHIRIPKMPAVKEEGERRVIEVK